MAAAGAWKSILGFHPLMSPEYPSRLTIVCITSRIEVLENLSQPQTPWQPIKRSIKLEFCNWQSIDGRNSQRLSTLWKINQEVGAGKQLLTVHKHLLLVYGRKLVCIRTNKRNTYIILHCRHFTFSSIYNMAQSLRRFQLVSEKFNPQILEGDQKNLVMQDPLENSLLLNS